MNPSPRRGGCGPGPWLFIAALHFAAALHWGLPAAVDEESVSPWPVDTVAPLKPLVEAYHGFRRPPGGAPVYPLFHHVVLAAAYAPYLGWLWLSDAIQAPQADYPYGLADAPAALRHLTVLARGVSLLMGLGVVALVWSITAASWDRRAAHWAAAAAALLAPLAYYARTANLDVPYLFWTLLALRWLLAALPDFATGRLCAAAVAAALAVASKDQAFGFFLGPALCCAVLAWRRPAATRAAAARALATAALAGALAFALANNLLFGGWEGFLRHLDFARRLHTHNVANGVGVFGPSALPVLLGEAAARAFTVLGPLLVSAAMFGFVQSTRRGPPAAWLLPAAAVGYLLAVVWPAGMVFNRYLLGPFLLALPFAGVALARLQTRLGRNAALALGLGALAWPAAVSAATLESLWWDGRYAAERALRSRLAPGTAVEVYTQPRYLPRMGDHVRWQLVANRRDRIDYALEAEALAPEALAARRPPYILLLAGSGLSGDPRAAAPAARAYFTALLEGRLGYRLAARFPTPQRLPRAVIEAGVAPEVLLFERRAAP